MDNDDFNYLADLIKRRSAIVITKDKAYLLESRLGAVARAYKLDDIAYRKEAQIRRPHARNRCGRRHDHQ